MKLIRPFTKRLPWLLPWAVLLVGAAHHASAQSTISVSGATSQFNPWLTSTGKFFDPVFDSQGGQYYYDFLGAAAGSTTTTFSAPATDLPSSYVGTGTINGVQSLVFRFRMADKNGTKDYLGSTISVGIGFSELSAAGRTTIFATVDSTNATAKFYFQGGGTGLNDGPSTTTLDAGAFAGNPYSEKSFKSLDATTWSYPNSAKAAAGSQTFGEGSYNLKDSKGKELVVTNTYVTFAVSFADLQAATRALTGNNTFTMTTSTEMAFVGWTSAQGNAINQDVNGTNASGTSTLTWSALGAFSEYVTADGKKKVVPEASTVVQVGSLIMAGMAAVVVRRRRAKVNAEPNTVGT